MQVECILFRRVHIKYEKRVLALVGFRPEYKIEEKSKKAFYVLTTKVLGECIDSCFSSKSRFGNEAEHGEHA